MPKVPVVSILVGVGATATAAAYLLYVLLHKEDESVEEERDTELKTQTSKQQIVEVKVPSEVVGVVIGKGGINLKQIENETGAKINFTDEGQQKSDYRIALIRGRPDTTSQAEKLLHQLIQKMLDVNAEEIWVPQTSCGRLIGKNGDNIRLMCQESGAKINIDRSNQTRSTVRRVVIRGNKDQIMAARKIIDERLGDEKEFKQKLLSSAATRSCRASTASLKDVSEEDTILARKPEHAILNSTTSDRMLEVFVSVVSSIDHFYVQNVGSDSLKLDRLVNEMTEYYGENIDSQLLDRVLDPGTLVASPFSHDNRWYRARVNKFVEDRYDLKNSRVEVFFVDFGDTNMQSFGKLRELHVRFIRDMPFQAVCCSLYGVEPLEGATAFSEDATECFEEVTEAAKWQTIMTRVIVEPEESHGDSDASAVKYAVELINPRLDTRDNSVRTILIDQGFARATPGSDDYNGLCSDV